MCVIIHKPKGVVIPDSDLINAHVNNPDGVGVLYIDEEGTFIKKRYLSMDEADMLTLMDSLDNYEALIHFRYTTVGTTTMEQVHPFEVLRATPTRPSIWVMHNGTISDVPAMDGLNDTQSFIHHFLKPTLSVDYLKLYDSAWREWTDSVIGWSKLAFMTGNGDVIKIGKFIERDGYDKDTSYFASNDDYFETDKRTITTPAYSRYSHYAKDSSDNWRNYWSGYYSDLATDTDDDAVAEDSFVSDYMWQMLDYLRPMSTQQLIEWVEEEPNEAFELLYEYIPDEFVALCDSNEYDDPFSFVTECPKLTAELLREWNY